MSKWVRLGEIASFQTGPFGTQLKASEYVPQGTPIINVKNIGYGSLVLDDMDMVPGTVCDRLQVHLLKEGDIVFGRKGSVDRHCYIKKENEGWMQGSDCIRARINEGVNPQFVSYYLMLEQVKKQIVSAAVGSTMPSLNTKILENVRICLPSVKIQDSIVSLLSALDDKIENNNRMNTELEAMAKSIYNYWFLQFEFPDKNGKPYKSSGGKMVWNGELRREIPNGWEVSGVERFGILSNGINYDKNIIGDKIYKIVNVRNISSTTLLLNKSKIDDIQLLAKIADKYLLKENDILIARSGIPGAIRVFVSEVKDTIYCGFIICLSLYSRFYRDYLVYLLKDYEHTSATTSGGTIMQNVNQETLKRLCFPVPDERVVQLFNEKVDIIWESMQQRMEENQELIALRDFVLPLLMNGQVGFKEE